MSVFIGGSIEQGISTVVKRSDLKDSTGLCKDTIYTSENIAGLLENEEIKIEMQLVFPNGKKVKVDTGGIDVKYLEVE